MSAEFYAEDLGIDINLAKKMSSFLDLARSQKAILEAHPWVRGGMVRVYIEIWSQNKRNPIDMLYKSFYDAVHDEVYFVQYLYGRTEKRTLLDVSKIKSSTNFSGANTKAAIREFSEAFYG